MIWYSRSQEDCRKVIEKHMEVSKFNLPMVYHKCNVSCTWTLTTSISLWPYTPKSLNLMIYQSMKIASISIHISKLFNESRGKYGRNFQGMWHVIPHGEPFITQWSASIDFKHSNFALLIGVVDRGIPSPWRLLIACEFGAMGLQITS